MRPSQMMHCHRPFLRMPMVVVAFHPNHRAEAISGIYRRICHAQRRHPFSFWWRNASCLRLNVLWQTTTPISFGTWDIWLQWVDRTKTNKSDRLTTISTPDDDFPFFFLNQFFFLRRTPFDVNYAPLHAAAAAAAVAAKWQPILRPIPRLAGIQWSSTPSTPTMTQQYFRNGQSLSSLPPPPSASTLNDTNNSLTNVTVCNEKPDSMVGYPIRQ